MKRLKRVLGIGLAGIGVGAAGCGAPMEFDAEPGSEPVSEEASSFVNNISFNNCTSTQIAKIRAGADILFTRITEPSGTGASMRACMNDTFLSLAANAEWGGDIWSEFQRSTITRIWCGSNATPCGTLPNWAGCASIGISGENLTLANQFVNNPSVTSTAIAGVIAHELAHNYGHDHPDFPQGLATDDMEYGWTIPERAKACVQNFNSMPAGQSRTNGMPGEVELGYVGRFGGSPFEVTGVGSQFISGIDNFVNSKINGVSFRLSDASGADTFTGLFGSQSGIPSIRRCDRNSDDVVVGIWGNATNVVNRLVVRCAPRSNLSQWYDLAAADGDQTGPSYLTQCPFGKAVRAVRGRSGGSIDQLRLVCDGLTRAYSANHAPHTVGPIFGTTTGTKFSLRCSGNGGIFSLNGRSDFIMKRLGGFCKATGGALPITPSSQLHPLGNWVGGRDGTAFSNACGSDELMVGVNVRSGQFIDAIQPVCANAAQWDSASVTVPRTVVTISGGGGGPLTPVMCPTFQFLVGLELWGTDRVNGLQAVCADMQ